MKKFKLQGVGIDTTNLNYALSKELCFDYVHTSLEANNEDLVSEWTKLNQSVPLVTSVNCLDCRPALIGHLLELGRNTIDILLVDSECDFPNFIGLIQEEIEDEIISSVGIKNPKSIEQLEEIRKYLFFDVISLDICPFCFNADIIKWCEKNEVKIIGFNPFGGRFNSGDIISSFGIQYLLGFASTYSDLLFLSGSDPYNSSDNAILLNSEYIGVETEEETKEFAMTVNINRLTGEPKKHIRTSIKLDEDTILPYNLPGVLAGREEILYSFGKEIVKITEQEEHTDIQRDILFLLSSIKNPEDIKNKDELFSTYRLGVLKYLRSLPLTVIEYTKVGRFSMAINIGTTKLKRGLLGIYREKLIDSDIYVLYMDPDTEDTYFLKLKKSEETA